MVDLVIAIILAIIIIKVISNVWDIFTGDKEFDKRHEEFVKQHPRN